MLSPKSLEEFFRHLRLSPGLPVIYFPHSGRVVDLDSFTKLPLDLRLSWLPQVAAERSQRSESSPPGSSSSSSADADSLVSAPSQPIESSQKTVVSVVDLSATVGPCVSADPIDVDTPPSTPPAVFSPARAVASPAVPSSSAGKIRFRRKVPLVPH